MTAQLTEAHPKGQATVKGETWDEQAACRGEDPELFFPVSRSGEAEKAAKAICKRCPVRLSCLSNAAEFGIWGGLNEDERRALRRANITELRSCRQCMSIIAPSRTFCSQPCRIAYGIQQARDRQREKYPASYVA
jgi:WhiB family redox-sensing transcriptional regulator